MKKFIGLDTYLYTFKSLEKTIEQAKKLESKGKITQVFLNNAYGFEFKKARIIKFK